MTAAAAQVAAELRRLAEGCDYCDDVLLELADDLEVAGAGEELPAPAIVHADRHPSAYALLGAVLGHRRVDDVAERGPDRWLIRWELVDGSWLSSTEAAYVHIARGLAVLDTHGPGPAPAALVRAVTRAIDGR